MFVNCRLTTFHLRRYSKEDSALTIKQLLGNIYKGIKVKHRFLKNLSSYDFKIEIDA